MRRIVAEEGVDPSKIEGTGRGGRITKGDVLEHLEQGGAAAKAAEPPPAAAPSPAADTGRSLPLPPRGAASARPGSG